MAVQITRNKAVIKVEGVPTDKSDSVAALLSAIIPAADVTRSRGVISLTFKTV
jgi:hypothetical protein